MAYVKSKGIGKRIESLDDSSFNFHADIKFAYAMGWGSKEWREKAKVGKDMLNIGLDYGFASGQHLFKIIPKKNTSYSLGLNTDGKFFAKLSMNGCTFKHLSSKSPHYALMKCIMEAVLEDVFIPPSGTKYVS